MGKGIGFKVLMKKGLSTPYMKSSILKGIEMGLIPLKARLYDMEGERYVIAADLVGEELDHPPAPKVKAAAKTEARLTLAEDAPKAPAKAGKKSLKLPRGKAAPKQVSLPKPRKKESEVDAVTAGAQTQLGTVQTVITPADVKAASEAAQPKPNSRDAVRQISEVGELTSIKSLILLEDDEPKPDSQ